MWNLDHGVFQIMEKSIKMNYDPSLLCIFMFSFGCTRPSWILILALTNLNFYTAQGIYKGESNSASTDPDYITMVPLSEAHKWLRNVSAQALVMQNAVPENACEQVLHIVDEKLSQNVPMEMSRRKTKI